MKMSKIKRQDVAFLLYELGSYDASDIDCDEFDVVVNDNDQRAAISITDLAEESAKEFDRLTEENQKLREAFSNLYEAFYDEHSSGALTYKQDMVMLVTKQLLTELKGGEDE